jgi:hypothetical protein
MSPRFRAAERLRISRAKVVMTAWPKSKELDKTVVEIDRQMDEGRMRRREKRRRAEDAAEVVKETDAASPTDPSKKQPAAFTFGHSVPVKLSAFGPVVSATVITQAAGYLTHRLLLARTDPTKQGESSRSRLR